ncbi:50S ribosomal protein L27 [Candidatus Berkelbacteria bacterium RIFCSPHIGHO2_12_FULL_36_9]|uniref:Large ribosomal subunit protein bL27 n=1 Tax=Candidatus Berkelbacteria bacterium RIFCSPHIGHO2_12_FULL_36_9 TaxID=1797469 RepID=A0A1F5EI89_9BACT|nr:MAG: 50S ribosomal protein L27 [Candidatus Berkelbacteria bacterium RIFCSPHIGHO2_12_FULL_36_9]
MAHTKAKGSSKLGRDSQAKRLGIKIYGGQKAKTGNIIVRQRGTKYHIGDNVALGKDFSIFALADGVVNFRSKKIKRFDNKLKKTTVVNVLKGK